MRATTVASSSCPDAPAVGPDADVLGLDVAVDDPELVRLAEGVGELGRDLDDFRERHRSHRHSVAEGAALHELHGDERRSVGLVDLVDCGDVRMVDGGGRLRLPDETLDALLVGRDLLGEDLEGDLPAELGVLGRVDGPHPAATDLLDDAVVRDRLPDHVDRIHLVCWRESRRERCPAADVRGPRLADEGPRDHSVPPDRRPVVLGSRSSARTPGRRREAPPAPVQNRQSVTRD